MCWQPAVSCLKQRYSRPMCWPPAVSCFNKISKRKAHTKSHPVHQIMEKSLSDKRRHQNIGALWLKPGVPLEALFASTWCTTWRVRASSYYGHPRFHRCRPTTSYVVVRNTWTLAKQWFSVQCQFRRCDDRANNFGSHAKKGVGTCLSTFIRVWQIAFVR